MLSRRARVLLLAGAGLVALLAAAAIGIYWYRRGPGFERQTSRLASISELRAGMTAAEIGAGGGRMAVLLARHLGPSGRLLATEIENDKLDAIRKTAAAAGLTNIEVLKAGEHATNLPDACCDVIYMRRVYHHLADAPAINKSIHSALRPGGRLAVVDFLSPRWLFPARHGISSEAVIRQVTSSGFGLERRFDYWSLMDYCLIFRRRP